MALGLFVVVMFVVLILLVFLAFLSWWLAGVLLGAYAFEQLTIALLVFILLFGEIIGVFNG